MEQLGDYRLRKRLAVGGMGEVYLGEKIGPEGFVKPLVIKCVLPQLAKDRAFVQLFLDEARLAALLNHPNIAQIYDFGLVDDVYFIAMEYVPGYTVDDLRRKLRSINAHMPLEHVASIASQACQGLHYAHTLTDANGVGLGLVHRDISPHNLIVSIDGTVKIVDFGIAKARAGLTRVQAKGAVGKFGYMSPEQSRGESVDGRSDVFSLGICMWELATNERLHDPKLDRAPEYNPSRPIEPLSNRRPDVSRQFQQVIETALAIEPDDRFVNAEAMHLAVERFLAAMTHYAGQAALSRYIKDLVEGRVENKEVITGNVVEPSVVRSAQARGPKPAPAETLEAAQKYEEVFGVTMENKRRARNVPKSWEVQRPPEAKEPVKPAIEEPKELELAVSDPHPLRGRGNIPPAPSQRMLTPNIVRPTRSSRLPLIVLAVVFIAGGALAGLFVYQEKFVALVHPGETQHRPAPLSSVYRVTTDPPGAAVYVDDQPKQGATPLELELIPDVEYAITVKMASYASKTAVVRASVGTEVRPIHFKLEPAATLRITSEPPGATLWVDGRLLANAQTPATLDDVTAGQELKITAEIKGLVPMTKTVSIPPGKKKALHFTLEKDGPIK